MTLPLNFVFDTFVLSIFEWPFKTGFIGVLCIFEVVHLWMYNCKVHVAWNWRLLLCILGIYFVRARKGSIQVLFQAEKGGKISSLLESWLVNIFDHICVRSFCNHTCVVSVGASCLHFRLGLHRKPPLYSVYASTDGSIRTVRLHKLNRAYFMSWIS